MSGARDWIPSAAGNNFYGANDSFEVSISSSPTNKAWGNHFSLEAIRRDRNIEALMEEWKRATINMSSSRDMFSHPLYRKIISFGRAAVPLLLRDLVSDDPPHWFYALAAITGNDPVHDEDAGDVVKMAEAWLAWGQENGFTKWQEQSITI